MLCAGENITSESDGLRPTSTTKGTQRPFQRIIKFIVRLLWLGGLLRPLPRLCHNCSVVAGRIIRDHCAVCCYFGRRSSPACSDADLDASHPPPLVALFAPGIVLLLSVSPGAMALSNISLAGEAAVPATSLTLMPPTLPLWLPRPLGPGIGRRLVPQLYSFSRSLCPRPSSRGAQEAVVWCVQGRRCPTSPASVCWCSLQRLLPYPSSGRFFGSGIVLLLGVPSGTHGAVRHKFVRRSSSACSGAYSNASLPTPPVASSSSIPA